LDRTLAEKIAARDGWLSKQPEIFRNALLKQADLLVLTTGEPIFHAGDDPGGIYCIVSGGILVYVPSLDGIERLAHIARPCVWFGHGPVLAREVRKLTFVAGEPSILLHVALGTIDKLTAADPLAGRSIRAIAEFTMQIAYTVVSDLLIPRSDRRIAAILLRVAAVHDGVTPVGRTGFVLKQTQLAEMANVSRHLVNQTLTKFEARGWIVVSYNRLKITDPDALLSHISGETERTK
jgi:CRP/FNR family cyclic AMP-dependent transcriptional regulator